MGATMVGTFGDVKRIAGSIVVLLGVFLIRPPDANAGPFRIAEEYNVFVFGDIIQIGTDVEGRVAAGGNVVYGGPGVGEGFSVASTIAAPSGTAELVAGGNVTLTNGSVGNGQGAIVYGGSANITGVGYGILTNGSVIDFAAEQSYLTWLSSYWGSLTPNGMNVGTSGNIDLTGTDSTLNVFNLDAATITTSGLDFAFHAPVGSTILVNVTGQQANLMNFGFFYNGVAGEYNAGPSGPVHDAGYPYERILFNFVDASDLNIDLIGVDGSILAPFAHIDFGVNSHVDGQLIAASFTGNGEMHDVPFEGEIPVPEPATLSLVVAGLAGLHYARRWRGKT
jgi:choice-of-anchor A domain-containing protein